MLPSGELMILNVGQADSFSTYECRVTHKLTGETRVSVRHTRIQVAAYFKRSVGQLITSCRGSTRSDVNVTTSCRALCILILGQPHYRPYPRTRERYIWILAFYSRAVVHQCDACVRCQGWVSEAFIVRGREFLKRRAVTT
ncbi:hypothetical protein J6590_009657 [Homalodisca vitripennis]|nr:hypothetical protein J6590_009657 [Homalodisca vitripennis]